VIYSRDALGREFRQVPGEVVTTWPDHTGGSAIQTPVSTIHFISGPWLSNCLLSRFDHLFISSLVRL